MKGPEHSFELQHIARQIRARYIAAQELARLKQGNRAVGEAILCGQALLAAKRAAGHGYWLPWLAEYCPAISQGTAKRYIRLASAARVIDLKAPGDGLRKAYIDAGILKASRSLGRLPPSV